MILFLSFHNHPYIISFHTHSELFSSYTFFYLQCDIHSIPNAYVFKDFDKKAAKAMALINNIISIILYWLNNTFEFILIHTCSPSPPELSVEVEYWAEIKGGLKYPLAINEWGCNSHSQWIRITALCQVIKGAKCNQQFRVAISQISFSLELPTYIWFLSYTFH